MTKDQIAIAYVRLGPNAHSVINGKGKISFQITEKISSQQNSSAKSSGDRIDFSLEGRLGDVQKQCFNSLLEYCKEKASEIGTGVGSVMSVQVAV